MAEMTAESVRQAFMGDLMKMGNALRDVLVEGEFAESQKLVPFAEGNLSDSGYVTDPVIEDDVLTVQIGYGRVGTRLGVVAIVQHERTDYNHPNGRSAKYLETPVLNGESTLLQRVARKKGK